MIFAFAAKSVIRLRKAGVYGSKTKCLCTACDLNALRSKTNERINDDNIVRRGAEWAGIKYFALVTKCNAIRLCAFIFYCDIFVSIELHISLFVDRAPEWPQQKINSSHKIYVHNVIAFLSLARISPIFAFSRAALKN